MRGMAFFFLTLHVGKPEAAKREREAAKRGPGSATEELEQLPSSPGAGSFAGRCCHRPAQAAALRNLPLRSIPSLVPAFMPGLSDTVARPGASRSAFAPPIHMAMGGHGFREGTACRLPRQHHTPPPHRQLSGNTHDLTPPQPFYQLISIGTSGCIHVDGIGGWQSPKGIRCSLRGTRQPPYLSGVVQPFPDVTDQELKVHGRPFFILM